MSSLSLLPFSVRQLQTNLDVLQHFQVFISRWLIVLFQKWSSRRMEMAFFIFGPPCVNKQPVKTNHTFFECWAPTLFSSYRASPCTVTCAEFTQWITSYSVFLLYNLYKTYSDCAPLLFSLCVHYQHTALRTQLTSYCASRRWAGVISSLLWRADIYIYIFWRC